MLSHVQNKYIVKYLSVKPEQQGSNKEKSTYLDSPSFHPKVMFFTPVEPWKQDIVIVDFRSRNENQYIFPKDPERL